MTEPTKAQAIDTELARHCAFTFPGAVLALGKDNWCCLKDTYELLASDMQVSAPFEASLLDLIYTKIKRFPSFSLTFSTSCFEIPILAIRIDFY